MPDRIEFPPEVKDEIAQAAMHFCSKRDCLHFTGYANEDGKPRAIAQAAHLIPAGKRGPRCKPGTEEAYIRSAKNGIWLCASCHLLVDQNPQTFPEADLQRWKEQHEALMKSIVGKDLELVVAELRNDRRYHEEARALLSFFDDRRVLYASMDNENASYAYESTQTIRSKIREIRGRIAPNTALWTFLEKVQHATQVFLESLGPNADWTKIYCGCGPLWLQFTKAVERYRAETKVYLQTLATQCGYTLVNI